MSMGKIAAGLCILFIAACVLKIEVDSRHEAKAAPQPAVVTPDEDHPTAGMKLRLVAAQAQTRDSYETLTGKVQNTGTVPIPDGEITIYLFDGHGNVIGNVAGVLDADPLQPGNISTFKVIFPVNEDAEKFGLGFTTQGSTDEIPLTQAPNVHMKF